MQLWKLGALGTVATLGAWAFCAQPSVVRTESVVCSQPFIAPHDLRGIAIVRLDVDGLPSPIEGSGISEGTLTKSITAQLSKAGIRVAVEYDADDPTLHLQVLAVNHPAQWFYVITAELYEPCRVSRGGGIDIAFCTTWSEGPRLGFLSRDEPSALVTQVSDVVKQFIGIWAHDNRDE